MIDASGRLRVVPPAFAAARISDHVALLDNERRILAVEGDTVTVPGDSEPDPNLRDGIWMACNNVSVAPKSASPSM